MLMVSVTVEFIYINYVTTITYVTVCVWCTLWLKLSKMVSKRSVCFCYGLFFGSSPSSKSFLIESWPGWSYCRLRIAFLRVRASHELTSQCTCHLLLVLLYCTLFQRNVLFDSRMHDATFAIGFCSPMPASVMMMSPTYSKYIVYVTRKKLHLFIQRSLGCCINLRPILVGLVFVYLPNLWRHSVSILFDAKFWKGYCDFSACDVMIPCLHNTLDCK